MIASTPVLLIEDDSQLARQIVTHFEELGLFVEHVADGDAGLLRALSGDYSLIILDIRLPGINGFDICRTVRAAKPLLPILLLTNRTGEVDRVLGFELGADDYIVKPFHMAELMARVRAKLRVVSAIRQQFSDSGPTVGEDAPVTVGELSIDPVRRTLLKSGRAIELTHREFDLLMFLMRNPGRVYTKLDLLHEVWKVEVSGYEESVVSMVRRLRTKIERDPSAPEYLQTSRGVGYFLTDPAERSSGDGPD